MKKMNKNLHALTVQKLKFIHNCQEDGSEKNSEEKRELTAFEKFKLTPEYRQILIKAGKNPEDIPTLKESSDEKKVA